MVYLCLFLSRILEGIIRKIKNHDFKERFKMKFLKFSTNVWIFSKFYGVFPFFSEIRNNILNNMFSCFLRDQLTQKFYKLKEIQSIQNVNYLIIQI